MTPENLAPDSSNETTASQDLKLVLDRLLSNPEAVEFLHVLEGHRFIDETSQSTAALINGPQSTRVELQQFPAAKLLEELGLISISLRSRTTNYMGGLIGTTPRHRTSYIRDAAFLTPLGLQAIDALRASSGKKAFAEEVKERRAEAGEWVQKNLRWDIEGSLQGS